jgi:DNA repair protein RadD
MKLRPYQSDALDAVKKDIIKDGASLIVMPTASGKSHVIAEAAALQEPVLILQPSQELLAQNKAKLEAIVPVKDIGIYSASFKRKDIKTFTFATIQSVYKKGDLFAHIPIVIIDEAHGLAPRSLGTMYQKLLKDMGQPKVFGFTATAYRLENSYYRYRDWMGEWQVEMATMLKLLNRMRNKKSTAFWKRIIYHISHQELLDQGYLSPLQYIDKPLLPYESIPINKSHSEYNLEAYAQAVVGREADMIRTIAEAQRRHKSVLVFCATTDQARHLQGVIKGSAVVLAETDKKERAAIVKSFKSGTIKTVFNVGTLTTGFDHPALDCVVLLRPTRSLPLYNQMLGRLTRLAPGKTHGTVIDLTGTCKALGRIETFSLYINEKGLWDLRTEKHKRWHDRVLFTRNIEQ